MAVLMEVTHKFFCLDEDEAERLVEKTKNESEGMVIDYKVSNKETKESEFSLLTIKERFFTQSEAKDAIGI